MRELRIHAQKGEEVDAQAPPKDAGESSNGNGGNGAPSSHQLIARATRGGRTATEPRAFCLNWNRGRIMKLSLLASWGPWRSNSIVLIPYEFCD